MTNYIESHQDRVKNKTMCKTIGLVEQIESSESICIIRSKRPGHEANICLSAEYAKENDLIGKKVVVLDEVKNEYPETKDMYSYIALNVQSIEKENGSK